VNPRYEPAAVAAALAALLQAVVLFGLAPKNLDATGVANALVVLGTLVAGWWIRSKVTPVAKVRDAGLSPEAIVAGADMAQERREKSEG